MDFVYWFCPRCGKIYNCLEAKENNYNCCCSSALKKTTRDCLGGITSPIKLLSDKCAIIESYFPNELCSEKAHILKQINFEKINSYKNNPDKIEESEIIRSYFEPKIQEWKILNHQGKDLDVDFSNELRIVNKLLKEREIAIEQDRIQKEIKNRIVKRVLIVIGILVLAIMLFKECASNGSSSQTCSCGKHYNTIYGMCEDCYEDFKYAKDAYEGIIND